VVFNCQIYAAVKCCYIIFIIIIKYAENYGASTRYIMPSVPDVSLVKTCFQPNPKRNLFYKLYPTWN